MDGHCLGVVKVFPKRNDYMKVQVSSHKLTICVKKCRRKTKLGGGHSAWARTNSLCGREQRGGKEKKRISFCFFPFEKPGCVAMMHFKRY